MSGIDEYSRQDFNPSMGAMRVLAACLRAIKTGVAAGLTVIISICTYSQGVQVSYDASGNLVIRALENMVPPEIINQPVNQIVVPHELATFSVVLADARGVTFQWRFNGADIAGATADSLLLANITAANEGQYSVVIQNSSGSATSSVAQLYIDSKGSGMPDSWQLAYFGNLNQNPTGDFDGDGVSNLDEFLDGTNPTNSMSHFSRLSISIPTGGGHVSVSPPEPRFPTNATVTLTAIPDQGADFLRWGDVAAGQNNPIQLVMTQDKAVTAYFSSPRLATALDGEGLVWTTGGEAPWYGQTNVTHDGANAARSGPITFGQPSWLQTTVVGPGILRFWWKVSAARFSHLQFFVNGGLQDTIEEEVDWTVRIFNLPAGTNVLQWVYSHQGTPSGADAGWVDQVFFGPDSDGDGLPDNWEMQYFGTLSYGATDDPDGDGNNNLLEFSDGTNPADASSGLARLNLVAGSGGAVSVTPVQSTYPFGTAVTLSATAFPLESFVAWTGDVSATNNPLLLVLNRSKTITGNFTGPSLSSALDGQGLVWTSGGEAAWYGQTNVTHDGANAARSGPITSGQPSWLQTTVVGPGILRFWWKVSAARFSHLQFFVNGGLQDTLEEEVDWTVRIFNLPAGTNVLRWVYSHQGTPSGADAGWVDEVSVTYTAFRLLVADRLPSEPFKYYLVGINGQALVVETSTNLQTWVPISTNVLNGTPLLLLDSQITNFPARLYRAVLSP